MSRPFPYFTLILFKKPPLFFFSLVIPATASQGLHFPFLGFWQSCVHNPFPRILFSRIALLDFFFSFFFCQSFLFFRWFSIPQLLIFFVGGSFPFQLVCLFTFPFLYLFPFSTSIYHSVFLFSLLILFHSCWYSCRRPFLFFRFLVFHISFFFMCLLFYLFPLLSFHLIIHSSFPLLPSRNCIHDKLENKSPFSFYSMLRERHRFTHKLATSSLFPANSKWTVGG